MSATVDALMASLAPLSNRRALDDAGDHDLADINAVVLQPLREQADEFVFRRIGEREAHRLHADGVGVHLLAQFAERAVCDENGAILGVFQIGKRLLNRGEEADHGDVEDAPHGGGVGRREIARLGAAVSVPMDDGDRAELGADLAQGGPNGGGVARVGGESGRGDSLCRKRGNARGEMRLVSRDDRDGEALRAEFLGDGG